MADYGEHPASFTPEVLAAIANGPIYDGVAHYCPAGRLSMAETKAREAAIVDGTRSADTACPAPVPQDCQARAEGIAQSEVQ